MIQILLKSGLFLSSHCDEVMIWASHLLTIEDSESGVEFFVACISQLSASASDYVDRILDAVSQAAVMKQSAVETVAPSATVEPTAIEGNGVSYGVSVS